MKKILFYCFIGISFLSKGQLNVTIYGDHKICMGDSSILTAEVTSQTGGTPSYNWSSNNETTPSIAVSPKENTTYFVTITLGQEMKVDSFMVYVNPSPEANAGEDRLFDCNTSVPNSNWKRLNKRGNSNLVYSWSPNIGLNDSTLVTPIFNPIVTTTYTLTVIDTTTGCKAVDEMIFTVDKTFNVAISPDVTICKGDSTSISVTEGYTYYWAPSGTYLLTSPSIVVSPEVSQNAYCVTITSQNGLCSKSLCATVYAVNCVSLNDSIVSTKDVGKALNQLPLTQIDTCILNYSMPLDSFKITSYTEVGDSMRLYWAFYQSNQQYTIHTSVLKSALLYGLNTASLQIRCVPDRSLHINVFKAAFNYTTTSTKSIIDKKFQVFPNPTSGILTVVLPNEMKTACTIELYTIDSKKLLSQKANQQSNVLDLSSYPAGMYLLKVISEVGMVMERIVNN